jgi:hypothetical protein
VGYDPEKDFEQVSLIATQPELQRKETTGILGPACAGLSF